MQRTTAFLAVLTAALAAAPAHAASRFIVRGAGFGHGVGMSQYGAYGYALHGKDHRFILAHYYTGTSIGEAPAGQTIRVLMQLGRNASFTGATRAGGRRLSPGSTYSVAPTGLGSVALRSSSGRTLQTFSPPLRVTGSGPLTLRGRAQNGVTSGRYRGALEFRPTAVGTLMSVNAVGLDNYVRGVVGAESPSSWPPAALEAQAVAARTYAITTGGVNPAYDQFADVRSQVYRGIIAETASTEAAVAATAGEVVTYQGKPVVTFFFSTSGGRTEDVENSFVGSTPKPWLKSVSDPYDNTSPRHRWGPIRMTLKGAGAKLGGMVKGSFKGISVVKRGESPRIVYADVVGTRGRTRVTGPQLRARFGLYDTWATFSVITSSGSTQTQPEPETPSGSDAPPSDEQTGGVQPPGGSGGGSDGTGGARAAAYRIAGGVSGRVMPARKGTRVKLQRRAAGRWHTVASTGVDRRGRYRFAALHPGAYRIAFNGETGPVVRL